MVATDVRIRTIKPEFWTSLTVGELDAWARLCWVGLWNYADDEGRGVDDARLILAALFPLDDFTADTVEHFLASIAERGLIVRYEVEGKRYFQVANWREHQVINRPSLSRIPPMNEDSRRTHGGLTEDSHGKGMEGKGMEQGVKASPPTAQNGNGAKPFYLADVVNLNLVSMLVDRYPRWRRTLTPGLLTGLVLGSKRLPQYGAKAVNAAIDDLYANASSVADPAAYLRERALSHSSDLDRVK